MSMKTVGEGPQCSVAVETFFKCSLTVEIVQNATFQKRSIWGKRLNTFFNFFTITIIQMVHPFTTNSCSPVHLSCEFSCVWFHDNNN